MAILTGRARVAVAAVGMGSPPDGFVSESILSLMSNPRISLYLLLGGLCCAGFLQARPALATKDASDPASSGKNVATEGKESKDAKTAGSPRNAGTAKRGKSGGGSLQEE